MSNKITMKRLKAHVWTKADAIKKKRKLQKESPDAAFRIFGTKGEYNVYQVWYEK